jgi:glycosyltransferase involved in cell wall biosynthesis
VDAADLVLFNCDFLANEIRARLKRGHEKLRVVHNGVDTKRFVPRSDLAPKDEVVILFVARMVPTKGADLLIRAARKIHGKTRRFKLRIVGRETFDVNFPLSPFELEVRKLAEPLGDCVEFIPFLDRHKILPVYQSASIFCAPSNYDEPCTLALPEAMSCGVASIASRRGGIPEVGRDAIHYFDPPEIDELAEHLAYLIEDEEARIEWGRRARAQAEAMDWAIQYRTLIKAIGTTGAEAPRPAAISAKPLQPSTLRK